jgi:23S rRNA pseudouridine955/2504/2580 synthase
LPVDVDRDGIGADTLLTRLRAHNPDAELLHRLDAQTGGILLAALNADALERGLLAFKEHALRKTYRAVALGRFERDAGELNDYLVKDAGSATVRVLKRPEPGAKPIATRYRVLSDLGDGRSLVELEPVTGRTHQLRAHMAFFGHPLLGDDKYGDRSQKARGLYLCCREIEILDGPLSEYAGQKFTAPEPDWRGEVGRSPDRL